MDEKVLEEIKRKLIEKKNEILQNIEKEESDEISEVESDSVIGDIVDEANNIYELQVLSKLTEKEQEKLQEINEALKRIEEGTYGICVVCGKPIEEKRLLAIPEAKKCLKCKAAEEKMRIG